MKEVGGEKNVEYDGAARLHNTNESVTYPAGQKRRVKNKQRKRGVELVIGPAGHSNPTTTP